MTAVRFARAHAATATACNETRRAAGTADEWYDQLGVIRVTVNRLTPERLTEQLLPWALATLAAGGHGFGRYYAALTTLDEDGEPHRPIAQSYIDWSGSTVLAPA